MSNYDPNMRDPNLGDPSLREPTPATGASSTTWIGAAIVAVILLIGIGFFYSARMSSNPLIEHRAAATDTAPAAKPLASPTVNPQVAPATPSTPDAAKP